MAGPFDFEHIDPPRWPAIRPGRWAQRVRTDNAAGCRVALLGLPDDTGVALNSGRPGARHGPRALRAALASFGTSFDRSGGTDLDLSIFDVGDVRPAAVQGDAADADAMHETHARITEMATALHEAGMVVVALGGGHDLTLPTVRALSQHAGVACRGVNLDPHLDVRDADGSGMPFRRLIEGGWLDPSRFAEIGCGTFSNAREHVEWLRAQHATMIGIEEVDTPNFDVMGPMLRVLGPIDAAEPPPAFVSIDLDCLDGSAAPGVSAVNPRGVPVRVAAQAARLAGRHPAVRHIDVMELSPPHDDPAWPTAGALDDRALPVGRTARLAALLVLECIAGLRERFDVEDRR
jgi:arginase family enzyme